MTVSNADILGASILIVDDQKANIDLLAQVLGEAGYTRVSSTMDPTEVASLNQKNRYDLILLDLQMPVMDGFEVMENLKEFVTGGYLPILVITAQPAHKIRALQSGAKDFIGKPFDLLEVRTRIHNILEVRLLYKKLENYNQELEAAVQVRTRELRESEERYRRLASLASDWYWEQDENMHFTKVSGPVKEMLGMENEEPLVDTRSRPRWNEAERDMLRSIIAERKPFLDFIFGRENADGSQQKFRVSGEPIFDPSCRFIGYRGIGSEMDRP